MCRFSQGSEIALCEEVFSIQARCLLKPAALRFLQEVMGSLHNLFGALNVVHVRSKPKAAKAPGGYAIEHVVKGQTMEEVLRTVQYEGEDMMESLRIEAEEAVSEGRLTLEDASALLSNYNRSLKSYTYLKSRNQ